MPEQFEVCKASGELELAYSLWCECGHQSGAHHLKKGEARVQCPHKRRFGGKFGGAPKSPYHWHWTFGGCALVGCKCNLFILDRARSSSVQPPLEQEEIPLCSPVPEELEK